jgi:hypothetical protein
MRDEPYATPEKVVPKSIETDIFPSSVVADGAGMATEGRYDGYVESKFGCPAAE